MYNNFVCFTTFPNPDELLSVFATINSYNNSNASYYNQIILKCRQLIFEISEVIACPQTDRIYGIYIIVKEDFYKTGELQKYLEKLSLRSGSAQVVQKCIYEKCCLYTIVSKLSPKWNLISNYLVQGRNFLTNECLSDSVRLEFNINDKGNTSININVNRIKIPKITLDNLYLTDDELEELKINEHIFFKEYNNRSIQVLPSLKRGKIKALRLKLNMASTIKTYHEMRRYWKNTYGYRLPETDKDIFYVDISFFDGSQIFTYPNLCIKSYDPIFAQRIDSNPIITNFIANLKKYVPTILSENYPALNFVSKNINIEANLLTESQVGNPNKYVNNLPNSCEINKTIKDNTEGNDSTNERVLEDENNKLHKSKLSQLLEELNKNDKSAPIYLTPPPTSNHEKDKRTNENKNKDLNSRSISEDLQKQLNFLSTSISQRASKSSLPNITNSLVKKSKVHHIGGNIGKSVAEAEETQLKKEFVSAISIKDENVTVPQKKRRIVTKTFMYSMKSYTR